MNNSVKFIKKNDYFLKKEKKDLKSRTEGATDRE